MDDAGRVLELCDIGDDSYGYAYLSALLTERTTGPYSVAIATDSDDQLVPRLLTTAGWALAAVDPATTDALTERFAEQLAPAGDAGAGAGQRRSLGLARALQAGALSATLRPAPPDLLPFAPVLTAHNALVTGRYGAAVALRDVLRELYPAALRAYPDPADPVSLAVLEAAPEPTALATPAGGRRGGNAAVEEVTARIRATGVADPGAITEAVTALRVAIAETAHGGGHELAPVVAETVRQAVAAVRACDAASTALANALAHGLRPPATPPPEPTPMAAPMAAPMPQPAPQPPPAAAPAPLMSPPAGPAPQPAPPAAPAPRSEPLPVAAAVSTPGPPPSPRAPQPVAGNHHPSNRPVSPPPPPPPGIMPPTYPAPAPRPAPGAPPQGSRESWPVRAPEEPFDRRRADRRQQPVVPPADHQPTNHQPGNYRPPDRQLPDQHLPNQQPPDRQQLPSRWQQPDRRQPDDRPRRRAPEPAGPPMLRLVEPTLPEELRDELGSLRPAGSGAEPPALRLVGNGRAGPDDRAPRSVPPVSADHDDNLLIFEQIRSAWFEQDDNASWNSTMDAGWRAAENASRPAVGEQTPTGLPRRVPRANLVPGAPPGADERPLRVVRDPASIAAHTTGYFNGWRRGQEVGGYPVGNRPARRAAGAWDFLRS